MRQLLVEVPEGQGDAVLRLAERHRGVNLVKLTGSGPDGPRDLAFVHVSNRRLETLLEDLQALPELRVSFLPQGVISLQPPPEEAARQVTEIEARSPLEIFLSGLQSIGSWKGFLSYAAVAGVVVWIGLYTSTSYLLVAAMLLAPFAGPAMTVALGTARGDLNLIRRGIGRYLASLGVTIAVSALLSLLLRQRLPTEQMVETGSVTSIAVLLPLAAGAAGAINLAQSERNSLVSGAAAGMLVAAALAPPAGLVGMAGAIGEWGMMQSGVFLLALQLLAINCSGAVVFRLFGVSARGTRFSRGAAPVFPAGLAVTLAGMTAVLGWQFSRAPDLQRSSREQRAAVVVKQAVSESGLARLVESNVRFTRADIPGQNSLLVVTFVEPRPDAPGSEELLRRRLTRAIQGRLLDEGFNVTPLVHVSVVEAPARQPRASEARQAREGQKGR